MRRMSCPPLASSMKINQWLGVSRCPHTRKMCGCVTCCMRGREGEREGGGREPGATPFKAIHKTAFVLFFQNVCPCRVLLGRRLRRSRPATRRWYHDALQQGGQRLRGGATNYESRRGGYSLAVGHAAATGTEAPCAANGRTQGASVLNQARRPSTGGRAGSQVVPARHGKEAQKATIDMSSSSSPLGRRRLDIDPASTHGQYVNMASAVPPTVHSAEQASQGDSDCDLVQDNDQGAKAKESRRDDDPARPPSRLEGALPLCFDACITPC